MADQENKPEAEEDAPTAAEATQESGAPAAEAGSIRVVASRERPACQPEGRALADVADRASLSGCAARAHAAARLRERHAGCGADATWAGVPSGAAPLRIG